MSRPTNRSRLFAYASALMVGTALVAGPALAAEVTMARGVDADSLDPHRASTTQSLQVTSMIFDSLLTMAADGSINPGLASGYEVSADGLVYSFPIRDGVKCHDGSVFDAAAAKASFDRAIAPDTLNPNLSAWGPIA